MISEPESFEPRFCDIESAFVKLTAIDKSGGKADCDMDVEAAYSGIDVESRKSASSLKPMSNGKGLIHVTLKFSIQIWITKPGDPAMNL